MYDKACLESAVKILLRLLKLCLALFCFELIKEKKDQKSFSNLNKILTTDSKHALSYICKKKRSQKSYFGGEKVHNILRIFVPSLYVEKSYSYVPRGI